MMTGAAARQIKGPSVARTFSDSIFWVVPEDFRKTEDTTSFGANTEAAL